MESNNTYKTTTDHAADIRSTLKKDYGWSNRKVSVKSDSYSMGSSIDVTIKHPDVLEHIVRKVASAHQSIRYCEASGEILSGGNRYVTVSYSNDCEKALGKPYLQAVEGAIADLETYKAKGLTRLHAELPNATLSWSGNGWCFTLWRDGFGKYDYTGPRDINNSAKDIAFALALHNQRIDSGLVKLEEEEPQEAPKLTLVKDEAPKVDDHVASLEAAGWL